jgi:hypothetical protein
MHYPKTRILSFSPIRTLRLKSEVATGNAMHTQTDLARFVVAEKHTGYLFTEKYNQAKHHNFLNSCVHLSVAYNFVRQSCPTEIRFPDVLADFDDILALAVAGVDSSSFRCYQ